MKGETLVLVGGGGHCRSCIDVIEAEGRYRILGIVDAVGKEAGEVDGYPILGTDEDLPSLAADGHQFLVTIGQLKSPAARLRVLARLAAFGASLARVTAPSALVSRRADIGRGTIVMHHALVNAGATVGENCIVNTKALVEHDASVGNHCHLSTASVVNGGARIGDRAFLGSGSVVLNQVKVGADCVVGAGSLVREDIEGPGVFAGSPLRKIG
jgi:sugar O-acyltransferase (sialic acid O-acetyltransferase NeuD family)